MYPNNGSNLAGALGLVIVLWGTSLWTGAP